jgi:soluble lytic murein transglycosylase-like protein
LTQREKLLLLLLGAAGIAAYAYTQQQASQDTTGTGDTIPAGGGFSDFFSNIGTSIEGAIGMAYWKTNEYPKYASAISDAENRWSIPTDLLARQLYQESRYRADVIAGTNRSPVGAVGIAQFMPGTAAQYGLTDRTDPFASIEAAAHYMHDLYNMFNDWKSALMAYNWGPGNVAKYNQGQPVTVPIETSQYVAQITADVPVA